MAVCLVAGTASALAPARRRPRLAGALKMLAASAYFGLGLHLGAAASTYGRLVLAALAFSWLGDLFLLGAPRRAFLAGLGSFLAAHLSYAAAFLTRGVALIPAAAAALLLGTGAVVVLRWLERHDLRGAMRRPVALYLAAITAMVALAVGTAWPLSGSGGAPGRARGLAIVVGAALFAASDVFVARERFVRSGPLNRLIGRPLYFAGQLLLAASVA